MSLQHWPAQERPREKLIHNGSATLSDAELLAILLRTGIKGKTVVAVARGLLTEFGSIRGIFNASIDCLCEQVGVGSSKAAQLHAALELGRRCQQERLLKAGPLSSPRQCEDYLQIWLRDKPYECFVCVFMDNRNQVITCEELFRGTLNQASVYPREVARIALEKRASAIIVAHNHPSGVAEPSASDISITHKLKQSLALLEIRVLDHLIIGDGVVISLAERGVL